MRYITAKEAGEKWGISMRRVQDQCRSGQISGVKRIGRDWLIPADAEKPADRRRKGVKEAKKQPAEQEIMERGYSLQGTAYRKPGTAERVIACLSDSFIKYPVVAVLARGNLSYLQGDIDTAYRLAREAEENCTPFFEARIGIQGLIGVCAMYRGDIHLWNETRIRLADIPCVSEKEREKRDFWMGVYDNSIYDKSNFPDWFQKGRLDVLPPDYAPFARLNYAKYLLVQISDVIRSGKIDRKALKYLFFTLPAVCEPLIAQTRMDGAILSEIYLRLICAVGYHNADEDENAVFHIDRAIELALPDRLYTPLAENRSALDMLLDDRLKAIDPAACKEVKRLSRQLMEGWTKLHNNTLKRDYSNELTARERELAKLAVFGLSNNEISQRLHITPGTVKTHIEKCLEKTGAKDRSELSQYI